MASVTPQAGGRILAGIIASVAPLAVIKSADESVTSSSTLQNDNELFVPVVANATYIFVCCLDYEGGTQGSSDFKWGWSVPSGAVLRAFRANLTTAASTVSVGMSTSANAPVAGTTGAGNLNGALVVGSLSVGSTAGNLQFQWAQGSIFATATIVHAQSFLSLWRVS